MVYVKKERVKVGVKTKGLLTIAVVGFFAYFITTRDVVVSANEDVETKIMQEATFVEANEINSITVLIDGVKTDITLEGIQSVTPVSQEEIKSFVNQALDNKTLYVEINSSGTGFVWLSPQKVKDFTTVESEMLNGILIANGYGINSHDSELSDIFSALKTKAEYYEAGLWSNL